MGKKPVRYPGQVTQVGIPVSWNAAAEKRESKENKKHHSTSQGGPAQLPEGGTQWLGEGSSKLRCHRT